MKKKSSYTENGVDKRIQTTVAHSYPMTDKENHIDVFIPKKRAKTVFLDIDGLIVQHTSSF